MSDLRAIFNGLEQRSSKWDCYFNVYEQFLSPFRGKAMTLVEVGIFNGGSLYMWREYLGKQARIIGIDLNPNAMRLEDEGFEIVIGDQADPDFWREFYARVGDIDVLIDDGGHRNNQQIITVEQALPHVRDGGAVLVEDVHASYMKEFGNPSRYSFVNYAFNMVHRVNSRSAVLKTRSGALDNGVWSVSFHTSVVAFAVDRGKSGESREIEAGSKSIDAVDFRYYSDESEFLRNLEDRAAKHLPRRAVKLIHSLRKRVNRFRQFLKNREMRKFF